MLRVRTARPAILWFQASKPGGNAKAHDSIHCGGGGSRALLVVVAAKIWVQSGRVMGFVTIIIQQGKEHTDVSDSIETQAGVLPATK
jgi:hypothetical protein